ncbi:MAG: phosphoribosylaminoimidazolesuccinocarboxamide synthase [Bacteroidota bacterium]
MDATQVDVITQTSCPGLHLLKRGKVRDMYDVGESLLIVATDRLSAFDVVMPQGIPCKGMVLTQMAGYWFDVMSDIVPNHLISSDVRDFPRECWPYEEQLRNRSMLVKKAKPIPVECIVRGYISGSGWNEYKERRSVCGIQLPAGLRESEKLSEAIFTPSTKAEIGTHDENIAFEDAVKLVGLEVAERIRGLSLAVYKRACAIAESKGIIMADTKMEFGFTDDGKGDLLLIDELLTPDSSRFWPKDKYAPGRSQESFDKQYVRDYLLSINFNRKPPGPTLPDHVIETTSQKYLEALERLMGRRLS